MPQTGMTREISRSSGNRGGKKKEFTMELLADGIVMTDTGHPYLYTEIQSENDLEDHGLLTRRGEEDPVMLVHRTTKPS